MEMGFSSFPSDLRVWPGFYVFASRGKGIPCILQHLYLFGVMSLRCCWYMFTVGWHTHTHTHEYTASGNCCSST